MIAVAAGFVEQERGRNPDRHPVGIVRCVERSNPFREPPRDTAEHRVRTLSKWDRIGMELVDRRTAIGRHEYSQSTARQRGSG
jgi:hypothetical protein